VPPGEAAALLSLLRVELVWAAYSSSSKGAATRRRGRIYDSTPAAFLGFFEG